MAIYLSNRDGDGKTNEEGHYRLQTRVFEGGILFTDDLKVKQNSPLGMSVLVSTGDYRLETSAGYSYTGWIDVDTAVTISTADPANPRITTIVLYVDKNETTAASPPNNPGIAKLLAVNGTPAASPTAPNGTTIQSAVGAGNPYMKLAEILVGTGVTQITNANITDFRVRMSLVDNVVDTSSLLDGAVTNAKLATSNVVNNAQLMTDAVSTVKVVANAITKATQSIAANGPGSQQNIGTTFTDFTNATGTFTSENGGPLLIIATFDAWKSSAAGLANFRVKIGSTDVPNSTGWSFYWNDLLVHSSLSWSHVVTGIAAGTYSVSLQGKAASGTTLHCDSASQFSLTIIELKK